jgi:TM2 domain-containing membrane protein YozV
MFCRSCGKEISPQAEFCTGCGVKPGTGKNFCYSCGAATSEMAEICVKCGVRLNNAAPAAGAAPAFAVGGVSPKSKVVGIVLALPMLIGPFGAHRFYAGKIGSAVAMLILTIIGYSTLFIFVGIPFLTATGIWALVDCIMIATGKFKDKNGLLITK